MKQSPEGKGSGKPENPGRRKFLDFGVKAAKAGVALATLEAISLILPKEAHAQSEAEASEKPNGQPNMRKTKIETANNLPEIFAPNTTWGFPENDDHDAKVNGIVIEIGPRKELKITQNGKTVAFSISNSEIILHGTLKGCKIVEMSFLGISAMVINGVGNEESLGISDYDESLGYRALGRFRQLESSAKILSSN